MIYITILMLVTMQDYKGEFKWFVEHNGIGVAGPLESVEEAREYIKDCKHEHKDIKEENAGIV
jgi:hypothetical protein